MYRKANVWCNDPSNELRDLLEAAPQFRNDEDTQPEIDHISRGERLAYRKRIPCYSNDKQPVSWHTLPVYAGRGVAFAPSFHTCFRNREARSHMFPCVSANIFYIFIKSEVNNVFRYSPIEIHLSYFSIKSSCIIFNSRLGDYEVWILLILAYIPLKCVQWTLWHKNRSEPYAERKCISNDLPWAHGESWPHIYSHTVLHHVCMCSSAPDKSKSWIQSLPISNFLFFRDQIILPSTFLVRPTICNRPYDVCNTRWSPLLPFLPPRLGNSRKK